MAKTLDFLNGRRLLLAVGSFFLLLTAWSVQQAVTRSSAVIDADYYSHGLRYHNSLLEQKAAEGLGWHLTAEVADGRLRLRLSAGDAPVTGGAGEVRLGAGQGAAFLLQEEAPGIYAASLPPDAAGPMALRVHILRDGARIDRALLLNL